MSSEFKTTLEQLVRLHCRCAEYFEIEEEFMKVSRHIDLASELLIITNSKERSS